MKDKILYYAKQALKYLLYYILLIFLVVLAFVLTSGVVFILWNDGIRHALMLPYLSLRHIMIINVCTVAFIMIIKYTNIIFTDLFRKRKNL